MAGFYIPRIAGMAALAAFSGLQVGAASIPEFGAPTELGVVEGSPLKEASGLVVSSVRPDVLFTHNDGSNDPTLYAIDTQGRYLATFLLKGFNSGDFEDLGAGPGPDPALNYLYLGDIGDNRVNRSEIVVYRIPEPWVDPAWAASPQSITLGAGEAFRFHYPDVAHDAESLMIDPIWRELLILTKESGVCRVYRAPLDSLVSDQVNELEWMGDVPFHTASGASLSRDGTQILLRQEDYARWWSRDPELSVAEAMQNEGAVAPVVGRPTEPNGEAIAWSPDANSYYTISDSTTTPSLNKVSRINPPFGLDSDVLVPQAAFWRYLDDGSNQGTGWRQPEFADGAWKRGQGAFGYGDNRMTTEVSYGGNTKKRHITTYFRTSFSIANPQDYQGLIFHVLYDDGFAVYLNGERVAGANLPVEATYTTLASQVQNDLESCWFRFASSTQALRAGTNVLAVEMHQNAPDSKDLRFNLQLTATPASAPSLIRATQTRDGILLLLHVPNLQTVTLQTSENLIRWEDLKTVEPTETSVSVLDSRPLVNRRFYRLTP